MTKPKVAHISSTYLQPSETFAYAYTQNLEKYEPIVLCEKTANLDRFPGPQVFKIKDFSIPERAINRLSRDLLTRNVLTENEYSKVISTQKPVILHAHFATQGVYALPLRRRFNIPLVTSVYGFDFSYERVSNVLKDVSGGPEYWKKAYTRLFEEGDLFLTYYQKGKRTLESLGCLADKVVVFPNGIDLRKFQFRPAPLFLTKERDDEIQMIMVNRFTEKKGIEYAIRALYALKTKHPRLKLKILGDGELFEEIKRLVSELGLRDNVLLPGFVGEEEVIREYNRSHMFLAPGVVAQDGDDNGGGNVTVLEAMAVGVPVIGTKESSSEFVEDGVSGLLCEEKSPEDLADKISMLLDSPDKVQNMVERSRQLVESGFDAVNQAHKLEEIYDSVRRG